MQNAKFKVIESLPNLIKTSKQKVQVVATNWASSFTIITQTARYSLRKNLFSQVFRHFVIVGIWIYSINVKSFFISLTILKYIFK